MSGQEAARARIRKAKGRRGIALFWLVTIIGSVGALFAVTNLAEETAEKVQEYGRREQSRLDGVATALTDYALTRADSERMPVLIPGSGALESRVPRLLLLPCPDNLSDTANGIDGLQDATCGAAANAVVLESGARFGLLPWNSALGATFADPGLGHPFEDGTGDNYWYSVARNVAPKLAADRDRPLNLHHLANAPLDDWLRVIKLLPTGKSSVDAIVVPKVAAVVIAPGGARVARIQDGTGDTGLNAAALRAKAAGFLDNINAELPDGSAVNFNNANNDRTFVDAQRRAGFDDRIRYISANEWWQEGGEFARRYGERVGITEVHNLPAPGSPLEKVRELVIAYHSLLQYYPMPAKNTTVNINGIIRPAAKFNTGTGTIVVRSTPLLATITSTTYTPLVDVIIIPEAADPLSVITVVGGMTTLMNITTTVTNQRNCLHAPRINCHLIITEDEVPVHTGGTTMTVASGEFTTLLGGTLHLPQVDANSLPHTIGMVVSSGVYLEAVYIRDSGHNNLTIIGYRGTRQDAGTTTLSYTNQRAATTEIILLRPDRALGNRPVAYVPQYSSGDMITVLSAQPITATVTSAVPDIIRLDDTNINTRVEVVGRVTARLCSGSSGSPVLHKEGDTQWDIQSGVTDGYCGRLAGGGISGGQTELGVFRAPGIPGTPITIAEYARYIAIAPPQLERLEATVHHTTVRHATVRVQIDEMMADLRHDFPNGAIGNIHCRDARIFNGSNFGSGGMPTDADCMMANIMGTIVTAFATVWMSNGIEALEAAGWSADAGLGGKNIQGFYDFTSSYTRYTTAPVVINDVPNLNLFQGALVSIKVPDSISGPAVIHHQITNYRTYRGDNIGGSTGTGYSNFPNPMRFAKRPAVRSSGPFGNPGWDGSNIFNINVPSGGSTVRVEAQIHSHEVTLTNGMYDALVPVTGVFVPPVTLRVLRPIADASPVEIGDIIALPTDSVLTMLPQTPLVPIEPSGVYAGWLPNETPPALENPLPEFGFETRGAAATAVFMSPMVVSRSAPAEPDANKHYTITLSGGNRLLIPDNTDNEGDGAMTALTSEVIAGDVRLVGDEVVLSDGTRTEMLNWPRASPVSYEKGQFAMFLLGDAIMTGSVAAREPAEVAVKAPAVVFPWSRNDRSQTLYPPNLDTRNYYEPKVDDISIGITLTGKRWINPAMGARSLNTEIPVALTRYAGEFLSVTLRHAGSDVDTNREVLVATVQTREYAFIGDIYQARQRAFSAFIGDHPMYYVVSGDCLYSGYGCGGNINISVEDGATVALSQPFTLGIGDDAAANFVYDINGTRLTITINDGIVAAATGTITIGAPETPAMLFAQERVRQVFRNGVLQTAAAMRATVATPVNAIDFRPSHLIISNGVKVIEVHLQEGQIIATGALLTINANTPIVARSGNIEIIGVGALIAFSPAPVTKAECGNPLVLAPRTNLQIGAGARTQLVNQTDIVNPAHMTDPCAWLDIAENNDGDNNYVVPAPNGNPYPLSQSNDFFMFFGGQPNL